ncbi:MAG: PDZ domain-containing protein [Propionibacteriaceae bacterium]|jgi:PDZ domain-containing protein|nr:PDZ domain-containing protein [Propionibacteriaceae bacterium]
MVSGIEGQHPQRVQSASQRRLLTLLVASAMLLGLAAALVLLPIRYVLWAPAAPIDLYAAAEQPAIVIEGTATYPVTGQLLLTPVSVTSADGSVSLLDAVSTFLMDDHGVFPREVSYPVGAPVEQVQQEVPAVMPAARRAAVVAALRIAGHNVQQVPLITHVVVSGPSYGRLEVDDIITKVDKVDVYTAADVNTLINQYEAGAVVPLTIRRQDLELQVGVTTVVTSDQQVRIGITMEDNYSYEPNINFSLDISGVTSAAGLILAIGVYDYLDSEDLIAGRSVAGTGVVDVSGTISAASGVAEKLRAAADAGADLFLLPAANCQDIVGSSFGGMRIVKVSALEDAIASLRTLRDDPTAEVPSCETP